MGSRGSATDFLEVEAGEVGPVTDPFARPSNAAAVEDADELVWAAIERLPTAKRPNYAILRRGGSSGLESTEAVDVRKLDRQNREHLVRQALATKEQDNYNVVAGIRKRLVRVGLEVPKVEVRFKNLTVSADVHIGGRALPTLANCVLNIFEQCLDSLKIWRSKRHKLTILNDISGVIKPGRMTLLLGPPGSGKSTLLLALAGKLDPNLQKTGDITYEGYALDEFFVRRTSAYISQTDNHIGELTVRETLDFAARCQGASENFAGYSKDLARLEKEKNIRPNPDIDAYMKAASVKGRKHSPVTDYVLKVLGLDVCADIPVGSDMNRGVSGGQKKRVTTGEMVVGPTKTLFMDEISTGLDSATTYQIVKCMGNFVHQMDATLLMSLLQPPPETFELFDDLILLAEGHLVYQGPRIHVLEFFESLGFKLPPRKGIADFLQEVTSRKDQAQYWSDNSVPHVFIPVSRIAEAFKKSKYWRSIDSTLSVPFNKMMNLPPVLASTKFAASRWDLFKACLSRELILLSRHRFLYIFRTCQ
ncbi:hypothetical protein Taro_051077, partial [Colocasia esculenta]|nr:hypothetical protein [Colocasia esculenta]